MPEKDAPTIVIYRDKYDTCGLEFALLVKVNKQTVNVESAIDVLGSVASSTDSRVDRDRVVAFIQDVDQAKRLLYIVRMLFRQRRAVEKTAREVHHAEIERIVDVLKAQQKK